MNANLDASLQDPFFPASPSRPAARRRSRWYQRRQRRSLALGLVVAAGALAAPVLAAVWSPVGLPPAPPAAPAEAERLPPCPSSHQSTLPIAYA